MHQTYTAKHRKPMVSTLGFLKTGGRRALSLTPSKIIVAAIAMSDESRLGRAHHGPSAVVSDSQHGRFDEPGVSRREAVSSTVAVRTHRAN